MEPRISIRMKDKKNTTDLRQFNQLLERHPSSWHAFTRLKEGYEWQCPTSIKKLKLITVKVQPSVLPRRGDEARGRRLVLRREDERGRMKIKRGWDGSERISIISVRLCLKLPLSCIPCQRRGVHDCNATAEWQCGRTSNHDNEGITALV